MSEMISSYILQNSHREDQDTFGFRIHIRNETSHTIFSRPELIFLKELKEKGMVIELPLNICQKGHILTLFFVESGVELKRRVPDSGPLKEAAFTVMAKTESLEVALKDSGNVYAELQFSQFDAEKWKKILEKFSEKQDALTKKIFQQHLVRDEE